MPLPPSSSKLQKLTQELNRLQTQQIVLNRKIRHQTKSERRARTRTLIQMGSLLTLIGLSDLCDITEGEDLQLNPESHDKAATLLGILMTALETLPPALSPQEDAQFKKKGVRIFKDHEAKKYRSRTLAT